jgi:hypothetical protein
MMKIFCDVGDSIAHPSLAAVAALGFFLTNHKKAKKNTLFSFFLHFFPFCSV